MKLDFYSLLISLIEYMIILKLLFLIFFLIAAKTKIKIGYKIWIESNELMKSVSIILGIIIDFNLPFFQVNKVFINMVYFVTFLY